MDFYTVAGKVGLSMAARHLPGAMRFAGRMVAGEGFQKVLNRFFPQGIKEGAVEAGGDKTLQSLSQWMQPHGAIHPYSLKSALHHLQHFDTNQDGQVTREELTKGIADLDTQKQDSPESTHSSEQEQQLRRLGTMMLKHYEKVAGMDLDVSSGISAQDLKELAARDRAVHHISFKDWQSILS